MARDEKVVIRLTDDVKEQFQDISGSMGMTISALGSFVIGDFVRRTIEEKRLREKLVENASEKISHAIGEMLADPDFEKKADQIASDFLQQAINKK